MTLVRNQAFSIEIMRAFNIPVAPTRLYKWHMHAHTHEHTHTHAHLRVFAEGIMTRSNAEMCLWLQGLDKHDVYMKMNVIKHCKSCSCFLAVIRFDSMLSHSTWQLVTSQGNVLATELKDSIYRPVTTQIYCSLWRWEKSCWILLKERKFWAEKFTLWPFLVILSNHRRLCGHQTSCWDHNEIFLGITIASCWLEVILVWVWARIDSKICRSDYETGRWEALKLKPARMESDACSANRHQPTAGCLKASDLWELDGYGNCCLTGFEHTRVLHEYAYEYTVYTGCANTNKIIKKLYPHKCFAIQRYIPALIQSQKQCRVEVALYY